MSEKSDEFVVGLGDAAQVLGINPGSLAQWATSGYVRFTTVPSAGNREFRRFGFSEIRSLVRLAVLVKLGFDVDIARQIAQLVAPRAYWGELPVAEVGQRNEPPTYAVIVKSPHGLYSAIRASGTAALRDIFEGRGELLLVLDLNALRRAEVNAAHALYKLVQSRTAPAADPDVVEKPPRVARQGKRGAAKLARKASAARR